MLLWSRLHLQTLSTFSMSILRYNKSSSSIFFLAAGSYFNRSSLSFLQFMTAEAKKSIMAEATPALTKFVWFQKTLRMAWNCLRTMRSSFPESKNNYTPVCPVSCLNVKWWPARTPSAAATEKLGLCTLAEGTRKSSESICGWRTSKGRISVLSPMEPFARWSRRNWHRCVQRDRWLST